jgi:hypothetical protein
MRPDAQQSVTGRGSTIEKIPPPTFRVLRQTPSLRPSPAETLSFSLYGIRAPPYVEVHFPRTTLSKGCWHVTSVILCNTQSRSSCCTEPIVRCKLYGISIADAPILHSSIAGGTRSLSLKVSELFMSSISQKLSSPALRCFILRYVQRF